MTATTYTVVDPAGDVIRQGLSLHNAAVEILSYDGGRWDVLHEGGIFVLHTKRMLGEWQSTRFFSLADDLGKAEAEIFAAVVASTAFGAEAIADEADAS